MLQVYGFGLSEQFLGEFMRETNTRPIIATKYAPLPWRFTSGTVVDACRCTCHGYTAADGQDLIMLHPKERYATTLCHSSSQSSSE